jgi:hypothetical protein
VFCQIEKLQRRSDGSFRSPWAPIAMQSFWLAYVAQESWRHHVYVDANWQGWVRFIIENGGHFPS